MTQRNKLLLLAGAAVIAVVAAIYVVSNLVVLRSFAILEEQDTREHVERARDALLEDIAELDRQLADWAAWDETYAYVADRDPAYVRSNIPDATYSDLRLNAFLIIDHQARVIYAGGFDLVAGRTVPVPSGLRSQLAPGRPLVTHEQVTSRRAGLLLLPEGPMLVASRPVLTSERTGPIRGTMIWGRFLGPAEVRRLAEITHLDVAIEAPEGGEVELGERNAVQVRALDARRIGGHALLRDISGAPALVMRVVIPRTIYAQGQRTVRYFLLWLAMISLLAAVVSVSLFERLVLSRYERAQSEQRYRTLVQEAAPVAILTLDRERRVQTWNAAAERIFGWREGDVLGQQGPIVPEPRREESQALLDRVYAGETLNDVETVRQRKNGTPIDVSISAAPLRDAAGRVTGILWVVADISDRKRAEAATGRQLSRLAALRAVDTAIAGSLDLRVTLTILLDQLGTHLDIDAGAILLFNPQMQVLEFAAGRGFRTQALRHTKLRLGTGHAGRAALERQTVTVPDLREAPGDLVRAPQLEGEGFRTYYAVPLLAKGQVKGVLELFHRQLHTPDEEWKEFLEAMAGQAAIAIDSASLFDNLQRANVDLVVAYDRTLEGWSAALDLRDRETEGHTQRVTELTMRLAQAMGVEEEQLVHIRRGALLHDIGKMGVPDSILLKPGPLDDEEMEVMRRHPVYAHTLLSHIPYLRPALDIPYCHHEKWDGTGYPRGLKGEDIPLAARIFAVVDVWDALRSDRPYRSAWPEERAGAYIREQAGKAFDPRVVEVFLGLLEG